MEGRKESGADPEFLVKGSANFFLLVHANVWHFSGRIFCAAVISNVF